MTKRSPYRRRILIIIVANLAIVLAIVCMNAQDRISRMPGYDRFTKMQPGASAGFESTSKPHPRFGERSGNSRAANLT